MGHGYRLQCLGTIRYILQGRYSTAVPRYIAKSLSQTILPQNEQSLTICMSSFPGLDQVGTHTINSSDRRSQTWDAGVSKQETSRDFGRALRRHSSLTLSTSLPDCKPWSDRTLVACIHWSFR
nr:hypothetical protein CFP56_21990 [Quercus suber]